MELRKLDTLAAAEKGLTFNIIDAYDEETDISVSIIGVGSRLYKTEKAAIDAKLQQAFQRKKPLSEEEENELWIGLLAKCTTGWKNLELDGKDVPFNAENAKQIYLDFPFIRHQVLNQIHNVKGMLENL